LGKAYTYLSVGEAILSAYLDVEDVFVSKLTGAAPEQLLLQFRRSVHRREESHDVQGRKTISLCSSAKRTQ